MACLVMVVNGLMEKSSGNSAANPALQSKTQDPKLRLSYQSGEPQADVKISMTLTLNVPSTLTGKSAMDANGVMVRFSGKNAVTPASKLNKK
jgi:hypothetical protein